jgi:DNA polymerase I-like protein with 3'-5' exonuclease and polymerase domains
LESCSQFKYLSVDTEGYIEQGILGISIANPLLESMYFPVGHSENVNIDSETLSFLGHVLSTVPYRIFHNAGHDLIALQHVANIPDLFELSFIDTMILGHMVDENVMSKGLDYLHKYYCGGEGKEMHPLMKSIIESMGWYHVPYALIYDYARVDAKITMELFLTLQPLYVEQFGNFWSSSEETTFRIPKDEVHSSY